MRNLRWTLLCLCGSTRQNKEIKVIEGDHTFFLFFFFFFVGLRIFFQQKSKKGLFLIFAEKHLHFSEDKNSSSTRIEPFYVSFS